MYNYFDDNTFFPNIPPWYNRLPYNKMIEPDIGMSFPYISGYNPNMNMYNTPMYNPMYNQMNMPNAEYTDPNKIYKNMNMKVLGLNNTLRRLWKDHVIWTKLLIMSIASGSPDIQLVSQRLLRNPDDFGKFFESYYGKTVGDEFRELLRQHLLIAADMVNALKRKETATANQLEKKLFANADSIAEFLSRINPYWNKEAVQKMMYDHLTLLKSESIAVLSNKYEDSIKLFDKIVEQAIVMADEYMQGILRQFPNKF